MSEQDERPGTTAAQLGQVKIGWRIYFDVESEKWFREVSIEGAPESPWTTTMARSISDRLSAAQREADLAVQISDWLGDYDLMAEHPDVVEQMIMDLIKKRQNADLSEAMKGIFGRGLF